VKYAQRVKNAPSLSMTVARQRAKLGFYWGGGRNKSIYTSNCIPSSFETFLFGYWDEA